MIRGFVVPHAPVLLDLPERRHPDPSTVLAVASLDLSDCDVVVLCSPHGRTSGVYERMGGDLSGQGLGDFEISGQTDADLAEELGASWHRPILEDPVDHGIVVPWLLLDQPPVPVIACSLGEWTGQGDGKCAGAIEDALSLAEALRTLAQDRTVGFIASAHGSAALTSRAPLTVRSEGVDLERRLTRAFAEDVGSLSEIPGEIWEVAGACGAGPLNVLGSLCEGRAEMFSYSEPFGVGYRVVAV